MKSKVTSRLAVMALLPFLFAALCSQTSFAQGSVTVALEASSERPGEVRIDIRAGDGIVLPKEIRFAGAAARFEIPKGRVLSVRAFDGSKEIPVSRTGVLQYSSRSEYDRLEIVQSLDAPLSVDESAFRSWFSDGIGVLFIEDLIPFLDTQGRKIQAKISIIDHLKGGGTRQLDFDDVRHAVIAVGHDADGLMGNWPFAKSDADAMASEILTHYSRNVFGTPSPVARFLFVRLPAERFGRDQWAAQTIGSTVLILSTGTQFPTQEKQRLHEQLRHEIFHLWFPNLAGIKGKYDWFYEGFALYESLKFAANSNRITFDDFLSSLSGAYGIAARGDAVSLISLSETRFAGSERQMYAKGMLVAFFTDVAMLDASDGKRSSGDFVKSIFASAVSAKGAVANDLILRAFSARPELRPLVEAHITGKASFSESSYFLMAGLDLVGTTLHVVPKPSRRERTVLDKLGYNAWRKRSGPNK